MIAWINAKEQLPDPFVKVLVAIRSSNNLVLRRGFWDAVSRAWCIHREGRRAELTWWMPFPDRTTLPDGWIKVEDWLPEPETPVLYIRRLTDGPLEYELGEYMGDGWWSACGVRCKRVVAWHPVPELPKVTA